MEKSKENSKMKERLCLKGLKIKEDGRISGLIATTHPDRVKDILSKKALEQIVSYINDTSMAGNDQGSYRSVSLYHDWIHANDPTLDEAGFVVPGSAKIVELKDGHFGVEVDAEINNYYKGSMTPEEIKYRIDNGGIAGFSIEYNTDDTHSKEIMYKGEKYRYIDSLTEYGGQGFARARMIANPHAVIYKEIENSIKEVQEMDSKEELVPEVSEEIKEEVKEEIKEEEVKVEPVEVKEEIKEILKEPELDVKEIVKEAIKEINVQSKVLKTKEDRQMEGISLSVKEMKESLNKGDYQSFGDSASKFFEENNQWIEKEFYGAGIPLRPSLKVKCSGNKLRIVGGLQTKDVLDTTTNTTSYTQSPVEFADLYIPGLIETFNNQANLFGALDKRDHLMGSTSYGWRIKSDQASSLSVDPDEVSVNKNAVNKVKLQTPIKEYRIGVSVSDYTLHHARASMGDLFQIEVQARMRDLMRDINNDLFTEQADGDGNKILGLEAVADSAGNTTLYGLVRSAANRLAPDTATDTYTAVGGATTTANVRLAARKVEIAGAMRGNLRFVCNPTVRDYVFELEDGNQRYFDVPKLGFDGQISYDGIPMIVDSSCQTDALFVIDKESYYLVISRPPQVVGLAKVGAAEEAYISIYLAAVYEQPRRCYMLDTLTS